MKYFVHLEKSIFKEKELAIDKSIRLLGTMIDKAINLKNIEGIEKAVEVGVILLEEENIENRLLAEIHYYLGIAYSELASIKSFYAEMRLDKSIYHYRVAIRVKKIEIIHKSNCLVNLANVMSSFGRNFDAIRYLNEALVLIPSHSIALGNKARVLEIIANRLYDSGHKKLLYASIYDCYQKALSTTNVPAYAKSNYTYKYEKYKSHANEFEELLKEYHNTELTCRENKKRKYKMWCLNNELFLNPLNTVMKNDISARDILGLPSIVAKVGEGPYLHSMYNNIKQEFVSARYLFFKGLNREDTHFSDEDVSIYNTLDYASHSYNNECVKAGFRVVYSLLDKMAYFVNIYFGFGLKYDRVNFNNIWSVKVGKENYQIRNELRSERNWGVKSLLWLSKELYNKDIYQGILSDFSKHIPKIRNYIEHKHLKIVDMITSRNFDEPDGYAMTIPRNEFEDNVMFLFKIVRDAIMYLVVAIEIEECIRKEELGEEYVPPMPIGQIEDEWKR